MLLAKSKNMKQLQILLNNFMNKELKHTEKGELICFQNPNDKPKYCNQKLALSMQ
jgi:hypothetical protein